MGLKPSADAEIDEGTICFRRTLVGLKQPVRQLAVRREERFRRTFLGLRRDVDIGDDRNRTSFRRTLVGLKRSLETYCSRRADRFRRTLVGLKLEDRADWGLAPAFQTNTRWIGKELNAGQTAPAAGSRRTS